MKNSKLDNLVPAVFLDRDGVINKDSGYVFKPEDLELLPGVGETFIELKKRGYLLIVITNQSGVARGYYGMDDVDKFHEVLQAELDTKYGVKIDRFYISPYHPDGTVKEFTKHSSCRKPGVKLVNDAVEEFGIDLKRSYFVGDKKSDIECAVRAGIVGIQVRSPKGYPIHDDAVAVVESLASAVDHIK